MYFIFLGFNLAIYLLKIKMKQHVRDGYKDNCLSIAVAGSEIGLLERH